MIINPTKENIKRASLASSQGELVGMPTETVYGIAANALDEIAVGKVFQLKHRPPENPLIVHVSSVEMAKGLTDSWSADCDRLAESFWPGPLTIVLPKCNVISNIVTGSQTTVGLRMPRHPVALNLIERCGFPLAAPSANRFMELSPTRAMDIAIEIQEGLFCILDGGDCEVGIESTVVIAHDGEIEILRPGDITVNALEQLFGVGTVHTRATKSGEHDSPGLYLRHYAPKAIIELVDQIDPKSPGLTFQSITNEFQVRMASDPQAYARQLYSVLKEFDRKGIPNIQIEKPPNSPAWSAIWDRLRKASYRNE